MTKAEFTAQLERGAAYLSNEAVSGAILRFLAEDLKRGEPEWWRETAKAWSGRRFGGWMEAWRLFLTAMHYEALKDPKSALVPYFPSCGGTAEADPARGVVRFLAEAPDSFFQSLERSQAHPFGGWFLSSAWTRAAALFFELRDLPFYLVDLNAGGGIDLAADLWAPSSRLQEGLVAARIGLGQPALAVEDISHRRWLTAGILPEQSGLIAEFDRAADTVHDGKGRDPAFVQLVDCPLASTPAFVQKNIPADDAGVGLLVFNVLTTQNLTDASYAQFARQVHLLGRAWGDRFLWVEVELNRGEAFPTACQIRASKIVGQDMAGQLIVSIDAATGNHYGYPEQAVRFLVPPNSSMTPEQVLARARAA